MIYFIQGNETRLIKIGHARHALERLSHLQTGSPDILDLIGVQIGHKDKEKELHALFSNYRMHGEWFESCQQIYIYIKNHCSTNHSDIFMAEWAIKEGKAGNNYRHLNQEQLIEIGTREFRRVLELAGS